MDYDTLINIIEELITQEKWEQALGFSREAVKRNRLNIQANYMLALCAENTHNYLESYLFYSRLCSMQSVYKNEIISADTLSLKLDYIIDMVPELLIKLPKEEQNMYKNKLLDVNAPDKDILENYFTIEEHLSDYFDIHRYFKKEYYIGKYNAWFFKDKALKENGMIFQSEIFETIYQGNTIEVNEEQTSFPCILPVATKENFNVISLFENTNTTTKSFLKNCVKSYNYYRLEKPMTLRSTKPMVIGKPISLQHKPENKKLILNIFIDSFNYKCIAGNKLLDLMPNTYDFFREGVICSEFYSGSEFTYPSVASYWTGCRPTHHQMLNSNLHYPIPDDMPLLSEIFQDNGYFTAKIGGNDSICPQYGYIRGIDRTLYGFSEAVFHANDCINETIEHLEAFSETDNFIWMDIQDLHYVAGYWPMPLSVQSHLPVDVNVVDNIGGSSLYQTPSPNRRKVYEQQLKYIDRQLKYLYDYILTHYTEDEFIVSLISDHGNGFNVDDGNYFICEQRMNVPLMLRGKSLPSAVCNERIETIDYLHIMTHLANIKDERLSTNDGLLPRFFGGGLKEREYIFSQSLFPDRYYSAMILGKDYKFYIQSDTKVENDCRVSLDNAHLDLRNSEGKSLKDEKLQNNCIKIVEEQLGDFLYRSK